MFKRIFVFAAMFFFICSGLLRGQVFEDGFAFNLPWNDSSLTDWLPAFDQHAITEVDRVSVDSAGHFLVGERPYRFFGGNLTFYAAFPDKSESATIAARMRKYGLNLMRFHHIDNPWASGSLFYNVDGTRDFNELNLDRLDYMLYQLKQHGVYINMNLNVSRTFEESDGVVDADSLSDYGKGLTIFDPHMIALQKEYAKDLLTHVNPYTGTTLAEDPALAMMEIINENSLFRMWYSGDIRPIAQGGKVPMYYWNQLDSLWHDYLRARYSSTAEINDAWMVGTIESDTLFYDDFEDGTSNWGMELHNTASGSFMQTDDAFGGDHAVKVEVTGTSDQSWHLQFKTAGGTIYKDSIYEVIFKAKADSPTTISLVYVRDNSPWTYYGHTMCELETDWKEFSVQFTAPETNEGHLRLSFQFENTLGSYYIDDFILRTEQKNALDEGESLEEGSVRLLTGTTHLGYTPARVRDQTAFFAEIQRNFLRDMASYLRDSLGVRAPITGTNWFTGPEDVYVQDVLDYVDNHAYWDHPRFPNQAWSQTDWTIRNTSMLTAGHGTVDMLFPGLMIKDKPYTVSEYNHSFPNRYQSELFPVITSYLSFNDADALMLFTYNGSEDWDDNVVLGFFDIHRNSNLMASLPVYSYVFRNALIDPAETVIEIPYSREDLLGMPLQSKEYWELNLPYDSRLAYEHRMELLFDQEDNFDPAGLPSPSDGPYNLNGGQIYWDKSGIFQIDAEKFSSISGRLNELEVPGTKSLKVDAASDFASVSWLSLVDSSLSLSSRSLLTVSTRMMNTDMIWDGTTSVHNNWGRIPALVAPLEAEISLHSIFSHLRIVPLDHLGQPRSEEADTLKVADDQWLKYSLDLKEASTLWFGVEGLNIVDTISGIEQVIPEKHARIYPNPSSGEVLIEMDEAWPNKGEITIVDMTGKRVFSALAGDGDRLDLSGLARGTYIAYLKSDACFLRQLLILN